MLVRKKYMVQKSFRISDELERDLGILSQMTEKSQNELVNAAIEEFLRDNKYYFLKNVVLEHFQSEVENADGAVKPFEMGGLRAEFFYDDNQQGITVKTVWTVDGKVVEEHEMSFENDVCDEFEEYLQELSQYISYEAEDTIAYLDDRLDYRDYIPVKRK